MATILQAWDEFRSNLELTEAERDNVQRQQNSVRELLDARLHLAQHFLTGSYRRRTAIRPLHDVDFFAVLDVDKHGNLTPSRSIDLIHDALDANYPNKEAPTRQRRSVNIVFSKTGVGYDVVPAYVADAQSGVFRIPDTRLGCWVLTAPTQHVEILVDANERARGKLNPLVKAAKHWKRNNNVRALKSFHLEAIALDAFSADPGSLPRAFRDLLDHLVRLSRQPCPDPTGVGAPIDEGLELRERDEIGAALDRARSLANRALQLAADGRVEGAHYLWRSLFGSGYPERGKDPESLVASALAVSSSSTDHTGARFG